jgi:YidC/Oxa1 family membrane protein insertase
VFTLGPLYNFVARAIVVIHNGLRHVTGENGYTWALSIIILVAAVRLLLVPLFVRQIKMQRTMQIMQPKIKEVKEKYKNDKQKMNEEMMKITKEHGNPLLGCLPLLLQFPLFISLYRVMNGFSPKTPGQLTAIQKPIAAMHGGYYPLHTNGLSIAQADQIAHAKIFGASLATSLLSSKKTLAIVNGDLLGTRVVAIVLIVIMVVTIYLTQKQIMGRNGAPADPTQAMTQKLMLYGSPVGLAVFGLHYSIGGLLYWFTTNLWSLAQQFIVIRRMPPVVMPGVTGQSGTPPVSRPGGPAASGGRIKLTKGAKAEPELPPAPPRLVQRRIESDGLTDNRSRGPGGQRGASASRRKKSRRGGRR